MLMTKEDCKIKPNINHHSMVDNQPGLMSTLLLSVTQDANFELPQNVSRCIKELTFLGGGSNSAAGCDPIPYS